MRRRRRLGSGRVRCGRSWHVLRRCVSKGRAFSGRGRIVIRKDLELETIGCADGPQLLICVGAVLGAFALNARLKEAAGVLEVAHQVDGTVVGAKDAEFDSDVTVLAALRLDGGDLNAGGKDGFHGFHGEGPGKGLLIEAFIQEFGLRQDLRVAGLAHQVLILLALGLHAGDGAIEGVLAGASLLRLAVEEMQAQQEEQAKRGENGHADAEAFDGRAEIGEGARGEIECDAHRSTSPPPARL